MAKNILVVDDNPDIVNLLSYALSEAGYSVVPAYSGKECLEKIKKKHFDLVMLDLLMPQVTGKDVIVKLRKSKKYDKVKIVLLTAIRLNEKEKKELKKLNVQSFVHKPAELKELIAEIERILKPKKEAKKK